MKIKQGLYLVIDPSMEASLLFSKLQESLTETLAAVQIWDNFSQDQNIIAFVNKVIEFCHPNNVPVLINNRWELIKDTTLDGVHFDGLPEGWEDVKRVVGRSFLCGITCTNDLSIIEWAEDNKLDYISFCSIFPSVTSTSCDLVRFENIIQARKITSMPIFLAGGIHPENIDTLIGLPFDGVAVVSGVMSADKPAEVIRTYLAKINIK